MNDRDHINQALELEYMQAQDAKTKRRWKGGVACFYTVLVLVAVAAVWITRH